MNKPGPDWTHRHEHYDGNEPDYCDEDRSCGRAIDLDESEPDGEWFRTFKWPGVEVRMAVEPSITRSAKDGPWRTEHYTVHLRWQHEIPFITPDWLELSDCPFSGAHTQVVVAFKVKAQKDIDAKATEMAEHIRAWVTRSMSVSLDALIKHAGKGMRIGDR